ncbi:site-specific DNA-methyltransferase [Lacrimispora amygdalina]|uniref:site-specific DNA-methyltransferase n=1 Tax=Lacrimispora amygdalina TaxID=253257 RepID=UPI0011C153D3|nr:site-specific DNA-methyltransferase [Clostridium indicum]
MELNIIKNEDSILGMKSMEEECVDLIVTDPPYKTITGGDSNGKNSERPKGMLSGNRKLFKHQNIKISDWMPEVYRILKSGSHAYIFTNSLNLT